MTRPIGRHLVARVRDTCHCAPSSPRPKHSPAPTCPLIYQARRDLTSSWTVFFTIFYFVWDYVCFKIDLEESCVAIGDLAGSFVFPGIRTRVAMLSGGARHVGTSSSNCQRANKKRELSYIATPLFENGVRAYLIFFFFFFF